MTVLLASSRGNSAEKVKYHCSRWERLTSRIKLQEVPAAVESSFGSGENQEVGIDVHFQRLVESLKLSCLEKRNSQIAGWLNDRTNGWDDLILLTDLLEKKILFVIIQTISHMHYKTYGFTLCWIWYVRLDLDVSGVG